MSRAIVRSGQCGTLDFWAVASTCQIGCRGAGWDLVALATIVSVFLLGRTKGRGEIKGARRHDGSVVAQRRSVVDFWAAVWAAVGKDAAVGTSLNAFKEGRRLRGGWGVTSEKAEKERFCDFFLFKLQCLFLVCCFRF